MSPTDLNTIMIAGTLMIVAGALKPGLRMWQVFLTIGSILAFLYSWSLGGQISTIAAAAISIPVVLSAMLSALKEYHENY